MRTVGVHREAARAVKRRKRSARGIPRGRRPKQLDDARAGPHLDRSAEVFGDLDQLLG